VLDSITQCIQRERIFNINPLLIVDSIDLEADFMHVIFLTESYIHKHEGRKTYGHDHH
jgi:hypothetical protein